MRRLIVNADDLGYSEGINEGIIKAHSRGIVTSTSLIVIGKAAKHGAELAKKYPELGVGLHFQIENEDISLLRQFKNLVAITQLGRIKKEFLDQINKFKNLVGKNPDHVDGHHHAHRLLRIYQFIKVFGSKNNIPLRGDINSIHSFYGKPSVDRVSPESLIKILQNLPEGDSELMSHPGIVTAYLKSPYLGQRELELQTLTSPKIKEELKRLNIQLISWKDIRITSV